LARSGGLLVLDVALRVERRRFAVEVAFCLGQSERFGLYGPSGSGKSTILDTIAGFLVPDEARILLNGRDLAGVKRWERRVGLVRQRPALFPHLSVEENIRYGARCRGSLTERREEEALCERLGIGELLAARPSQLSGGQAQRVALARALRAPSEALLLDEPFQGLDPPLRGELIALVREEAARRALPVILVAHELEQVQAFADRIAVLDEGRILQIDTPTDLVRRPASVRVALLVGYSAILPVGHGGVQVGIHPGAIRFVADPERGLVVSGVLRSGVPAGLGQIAELEVAEQLVRIPCERLPAAVGEQVAMTVVDPPFFGGDGRRVDPCGGASRLGPVASVLPW
jgi:ABC-type sulfate/molybdate transport systems ATPase subunit